MIVRIEIDGNEESQYDYRVSYESEALYSDAGLSSIVEALVAAVEGLAPDVVGVEVWYRGVVSGTYPLQVIAMNHEQIAAHAVNTTAAIKEVSS